MSNLDSFIADVEAAGADKEPINWATQDNSIGAGIGSANIYMADHRLMNLDRVGDDDEPQYTQAEVDQLVGEAVANERIRCADLVRGNLKSWRWIPSAGVKKFAEQAVRDIKRTISGDANERI